ncbi:MAG TPA: putative beta-lysine N-acetyltransferase [candidate division Zixibacteria bacterium]|nr:putative beta-lysine N-acetyltransferase [candidate division Zixibacteria bacterium]
MTSALQQQDTIEKFHGSIIQHGPLSNRIYLMKIGEADPDELVAELAKLAHERGYTKIFAKVPVGKVTPFEAAGYTVEAKILGFYNGVEAADFLGYYPDKKRRELSNEDELNEVIDITRRKNEGGASNRILPEHGVLRLCQPSDVARMAYIYREVFPSYPFPIDNPDYLLRTMRTHVLYFGVEVSNILVSLSSAEMDEASGNVEMTDFATLPNYRGNSFATVLLEQMENAMRVRGVKTAYTIARAISPGMNITFARCGYAFGGRLINNTNISGSIESMNVWYKSLV